MIAKKRAKKPTHREKKWTHAQLVKQAVRYFKTRYPVVITECAHSAGEEADVLCFDGRVSVVAECKATRADFLADAKKVTRSHRRGMGDKRVYFVPQGLVTADEVPDEWGLLEITPRGRVMRTQEAARVSVEPADKRAEISTLVSMLRRLGTKCVRGCSVRVYTYETASRTTLTVWDPTAGDEPPIDNWKEEPEDNDDTPTDS